MTTLTYTEIEDYLRIMAHVRNKDGEPPRGFEAFVLAWGRRFEYAPLPASIRKGRNRQCFMNAHKLMSHHLDEYVYCEGWASGIIPVHHAWVVTRSGVVIDNTWERKAREQRVYFGVPFRWRYVFRTVCDSGTYGLFYKEQTFELAEDPQADWSSVIDDVTATRAEEPRRAEGSR